MQAQLPGFELKLKGKGINGTTSHSDLSQAAAHGFIKECEELLLAGKDINTADDLGWTPLMHAVRNGHSDLAEILLSHGADACFINRHGVTVFTMTVFNCDEDMLRTLYEYLTPELKQTESNNALQVACARGLYTSVKWLLSNTAAQINLVSNLTGVTPLELAAIGHHSSLIELLLQYGADPNSSNSLGHNGQELIQINGGDKMLSLLQDNEGFSTHSTNCIDFKKIKNIEPVAINSIYTSNNVLLDLSENIVLKNSPSRAVFKTKSENCADLKNDCEIKSLLSPSLKSVFLPSPQMCSTPISGKYDYNCLISPKHHSQSLMFESPEESPQRGKKRKHTSSIGCSTWLKRFTKRRTKSFEDSGSYIDYDTLRNNRIDLTQLLYGKGLHEFYSIFKEQELDMWTFLTLTKEDLFTMGIHEESSQVKILKCIESLRKAPF